MQLVIYQTVIGVNVQTAFANVSLVGTETSATYTAAPQNAVGMGNVLVQRLAAAMKDTLEVCVRLVCALKVVGMESAEDLNVYVIEDGLEVNVLKYFVRNVRMVFVIPLICVAYVLVIGQESFVMFLEIQ